MPGPDYSRRRFLRQSFAFSAAAMTASVGMAGCGRGIVENQFLGSHLLMLGDWGESGDYSAQTTVASAMKDYVIRQNLKIDSLLMLGDNFTVRLTEARPVRGGIRNLNRCIPRASSMARPMRFPATTTMRLLPWRSFPKS